MFSDHWELRQPRSEGPVVGFDVPGRPSVVAAVAHDRDGQPGSRYSSHYVPYAFDGSILYIPGRDGVVGIKYVLARESVYARAVWPAVWHAWVGWDYSAG